MTVSSMKFHELYAANIVIGFARLGGHCIGIVANQPSCLLAGSSISNSSDKAARFVRFCDALNIPNHYFCGCAPVFARNRTRACGIIRHGAKLLYAYCEATVPKITVITLQGLRRLPMTL